METVTKVEATNNVEKTSPAVSTSLTVTMDLLQKNIEGFVSQLSHTELKEFLKSRVEVRKATEISDKFQSQLNTLNDEIPVYLNYFVGSYVMSMLPDICKRGKIIEQLMYESKEILEMEKLKELDYQTICQRLHNNENTENFDLSTDISKQFLDRVAESFPTYNEHSIEFAKSLIPDLRTDWWRPVQILVKVNEGVQIIIIRGTAIVVSKCISEVELLINENISQVHFVADEIVFIDHSLNGDIWNGKSVLVMAKKINCVPQETSLVWELSGKSKSTLLSVQKHVAENKQHSVNINQGLNGKPGQSGGHILFVSLDFVRPELLTVKSNGGRGQNGQNGDDGPSGINGLDGVSVNLNILQQPKADSGARLLTDLDLSTVLNYIKSKTSSDNDLLDRHRAGTFEATGLLQNGIKYVVIHYRSIRTNEAIVLFEGTAATAGSMGYQGGCGGMGGLGGLPGSVVALNLKTGQFVNKIFKGDFQNGSDGDDGVNGTNGKQGVDGKKGEDIAFIFKNSTVWFIRGNNLQIQEVNQKSKEVVIVWSAARKSYVTVKSFETVQNIQTNDSVTASVEEKSVNKQQALLAEKAIPQLNIDRIKALAMYESLLCVNDIDLAMRSKSKDWWYNWFIESDDD